VDPADELTVDEVRRYSRHLIIPDVGMSGQKRLKNAKVLCVGAGGLGSPSLMYLAAAGVGTLGIVEFDVVDESNLQRQIIHGQSDIGRPKAESARDSVLEINPYVTVNLHTERLDSSNVMELFSQYDLIVDGTDNFATRYLVNDACVLNYVRANANHPGATLKTQSVTMKIYQAKKNDIIQPGPLGYIHLSKHALSISLKDGVIDIIEIQIPGKKKLLIKDFLNGQKLFTENMIIKEI